MNPLICFLCCPRNPQHPSKSFHLKCVQTCFFILLRVQLSQPYVATGHTSAVISRILVEIGMLWLFHLFFSDASIACPLFNLVRNSIVHSPSSVIRDPRYGNVSTVVHSEGLLHSFKRWRLWREPVVGCRRWLWKEPVVMCGNYTVSQKNKTPNSWP